MITTCNVASNTEGSFARDGPESITQGKEINEIRLAPEMGQCAGFAALITGRCTTTNHNHGAAPDI
jgi:hypothetical protein